MQTSLTLNNPEFPGKFCKRVSLEFQTPANQSFSVDLYNKFSMGLTIKKFSVKSSYRSRERIEVDFMIDSGAVYSLVPKGELEKLGIAPYKKLDFFLADGTKITRQVGDAYFEYAGEGVPHRLSSVKKVMSRSWAQRPSKVARWS
jgi:predicted aspartyl protease